MLIQTKFNSLEGELVRRFPEIACSPIDLIQAQPIVEVINGWFSEKRKATERPIARSVCVSCGNEIHSAIERGTETCILCLRTGTDAAKYGRKRKPKNRRIQDE